MVTVLGDFSTNFARARTASRALGEAKRFYLPDPRQTVTWNSVGNKQSVYFIPVGF
jgi:hypothetical protein